MKFDLHNADSDCGDTHVDEKHRAHHVSEPDLPDSPCCP